MGALSLWMSLAAAAAAPASAATLEPSGYLKNVWQHSKSALDGRPYYLDTFRGRLTLDGAHGPVRASVSYDHQVAWGTWFYTTEHRLFGYAPPKPWLDAEQTISTDTLNGYGHGLYRGWLGVEGERGVVRAGRQRIAWGTNKLWNPVDVLNPYQPVTVERDERRGVDALYGRLALGDLSQAELAWAPNDRWPEHALLARLRGNARGWDASLLGGKIAGSTGSVMMGGDFAGELLGGTLHGEAAWFDPQDRPGYWKAGAGWDYTLRDGSFLVEFYRSGRGAVRPGARELAEVRAGREATAGRNYAGASGTWDLHPLVKAEAAAVLNADDGSSFFYPSVSWNALADLWLTAAWQRFGGGLLSELGRQPNQTVLTAQWFF